MEIKKYFFSKQNLVNLSNILSRKLDIDDDGINYKNYEPTDANY